MRKKESNLAHILGFVTYTSISTISTLAVPIATIATLTLPYYFSSQDNYGGMAVSLLSGISATGLSIYSTAVSAEKAAYNLAQIKRKS